MPVPLEEAERRLAVLSEGIRAAGLRLTHQRLEVARVLAAAESHPDVETVFRRVRLRVPTISLDTVYRTLASLEESGLVERIAATAGPTRYDGNPFPHHHFVCRSCGLVRDINDINPATLCPSRQAETLGDVEAIHIEYRGICTACQQATTPRNSRSTAKGE